MREENTSVQLVKPEEPDESEAEGVSSSKMILLIFGMIYLTLIYLVMPSPFVTKTNQPATANIMSNSKGTVYMDGRITYRVIREQDRRKTLALRRLQDQRRNVTYQTVNFTSYVKVDEKDNKYDRYKLVIHSKIIPKQKPPPEDFEKSEEKESLPIENPSEKLQKLLSNHVNKISGVIKDYINTTSNSTKANLTMDSLALRLQKLKEDTENVMETFKIIETAGSVKNKVDNFKKTESHEAFSPGNIETNEVIPDGNVGKVVVKPTTRAEDCNNCFMRPYEFVINSPEVCANTDSDLDLIILITTTAAHKSRRDGIRETWASVTEKNTHGRVRYVFLLGETSDEINTQISFEREEFKDIALQSFHDTYRNLTLKTLMGFEWAESFCPAAQHIMKTDDDMFVNVPSILELLRSKDLQNKVVGSCSITADPIRDKKSKWYVSERQYPNSHYPGFCSGTGYVTSSSVTKDVLKISPSIPFFYLEDVYVSLCLNKLGFKLENQRGFYNWKPQPLLRACSNYGSGVYTFHGIIPPELQKYWKKCGSTI